MAELLDIYDENMTPIGIKERDEVHRDGDWHKSFQMWIVYRDDSGKDFIVVQKRSPDKKLFPNYLDTTVAGHYTAGESMEDGLREVKEELGIEVDFKDLISLGVRVSVAKVGSLLDREFCDVFLLNYHKDILDYQFDREEVSGLAVFHIDDGLAMCAGEKDTLKARSVMANSKSPDENLSVQELDVSVSDFIPDNDPYLYKILVLAKRYLNGEKHLLI